MLIAYQKIVFYMHIYALKFTCLYFKDITLSIQICQIETYYNYVCMKILRNSLSNSILYLGTGCHSHFGIFRMFSLLWKLWQAMKRDRLLLFRVYNLKINIPKIRETNFDRVSSSSNARNIHGLPPATRADLK